MPAKRVPPPPAKAAAAKAAEPSPAPARAAAAKPTGAIRPAAKSGHEAAASKPAPPFAPPAAKVATVSTAQLAAGLAERHEMAPRQARAVVQDLMSSVAEHLKAGSKLKLAGLGVLQVRHREARTGRNPATGESVQIAASRKVVFRPAKELKELV